MTRAVCGYFFLTAILILRFTPQAHAYDPQHEFSATIGQHHYLKSNYLKRADEYYDTDRLNSGGFEADYLLKIKKKFGFITGVYYYRAYEEYNQNDGQLRVKLESRGLLFGPVFLFPIKSRFTAYVGAGVDLAQHTTTLEMDSAGDNITAGNERRTGIGAHIRAGASIDLSPSFRLLVEDRHSYIPIIDYAGSGETFDVGGNFIQGGVSYMF